MKPSKAITGAPLALHTPATETPPPQAHKRSKKKKKKKVKYEMVPRGSPTFQPLGECCPRLSLLEGGGQSVQGPRWVSGPPALGASPLAPTGRPQWL